MKDIGKRLKEFRESLNMDQQSFAQSVGLSGRDTISKWERGLHYPSADILAIMRKKYLLNVDWLVSGEGEMLLSAGARPNLGFIDPAVQLVEEAIQETGVWLSDRQKRAAVEMIREEMVKRTGNMIKALKGGSTND
ncbi:MAG: helix-turn-helix domain-containing protein [Desulfobaccales bacterium]